MIYTEPVLLLGTLSVGEAKIGYELKVENSMLVFTKYGKVEESELILE